MFNDIRETAFSPAYQTIQKSLPDNRNLALVPASYYDAIEGAREVRENILGLVNCIIGVLQERVSDFQGVNKDSDSH
jgi:hypothetical protein